MEDGSAVEVRKVGSPSSGPPFPAQLGTSVLVNLALRVQGRSNSLILRSELWIGPKEKDGLEMGLGLGPGGMRFESKLDVVLSCDGEAIECSSISPFLSPSSGARASTQFVPIEGGT